MARIRQGGDTEVVTAIDRVVLGGLGVGLVLLVLNGLRSVEARVPGGPDPATGASPGSAMAPSPPGSRRDDVDLFLSGLDRLRHNDETVVDSLREQSLRLCKNHGRCDFRAMLTYFEGLTAEQRAAGLASEARFLELRSEITRARDRDLGLKEWQALRDRSIEALRRLRLPLGNSGDCIPGARALSLCSLLEVEWIERDSGLAPEQREPLISAAEGDARESIALFEQAGCLTPQLEPRWLLGRLAAARGFHEAAQSAFVDCLGIARRVENEAFAEHSLLSLIALAREVGDLSEVERLVDELAAFRSPSQSWPLARAQAELLFERDEAEMAVEFLTQHEPSDPSALRDWHLLLASALQRVGRHDEARDHYESEANSPGSLDLAWSAASLGLRAGNPSEVVEKFEDTELLNRLRPSLRMNADALLGEAYLRLERYDVAARHLTQALEMASQVQTRLEAQRAHDKGAVSVLGEWVGMQTLTFLAEARARTNKPLEAAREIEAYQAHTLRYEISAGDRGGRGRNDVRAFRDSDLLEWARAFELGFVTWVVGADSSVVAYVGPDGSAVAAPIARGRKAIEEAVRRLREATVAGDEGLLLRRLREVRFELLPAEILAQLARTRGSTSGRLLFLLHGPLEKLPVELLALDGDPFGERCIPVVLPGLPGTLPGARPSQREFTAWTLLGGPVDDAGVPLLPGALEEITEISRLHAGSRSWVGAAFDRQALRDALTSRTSLHIATHLRSGCGSRQGRLADVGLELSRGDSFCAREVMQAKPALPLAVLDACETAGGRFVDGEGLQGISRAFLESGTQNLVVTLWPVDDRVARAFAVAFHRALLQGDRPSEACARARRALRLAGDGPVDWAAFRAIGRD